MTPYPVQQTQQPAQNPNQVNPNTPTVERPTQQQMDAEDALYNQQQFQKQQQLQQQQQQTIAASQAAATAAATVAQATAVSNSAASAKADVDKVGAMTGGYVAEQTSNVGANNQNIQNYAAQVYDLGSMPNEGNGFNGSSDLNPNWVINSAAEQIDSLNNERLHWNISGLTLEAPHYVNSSQNTPLGQSDMNSMWDSKSGTIRSGDFQDQPFLKRQRTILQDPANQEVMSQHGFNLSDAGTKGMEAYASYKTLAGAYSNLGDAVQTFRGGGETLTNAGESLIDRVVGKAATADETLAEYGGEEIFGEGGLTALAEGGAATLAEVGLDAALIGGFVAGGEVIAAAGLVGFGLYEGYKALGGTPLGGDIDQGLDKAKSGLSSFESFAKGLFGN